ncbi:Desiccation-related protein PCC13-62 [Carex littledalei]|uniref:Desiccation-related protein PCC13-62 n=1 Tax=Carex littledalei TaxID=544730 RepID=A0A833QLL5_9POAL|nr:Desiccation-related protein PCC13-62 [Carex littledalei]
MVSTLDKEAPNLTAGGPPPKGGRISRSSQKTVKGFPRPQLDISAENFAKIVDTAFKFKLNPPFDPYANGINYLIASYINPYVGLTGYVGANPELRTECSSEGRNMVQLVAGLPGVESAQDAVIRWLLFERASQKVHPYNITVAEFTDRISDLRNKLGKKLGCEGRGLSLAMS